MNDGRGKKSFKPTNHRQGTEDRLVMGGFAIVMAVGGLLVMALMGTGPAVLAVGVVLLAAGILVALYVGFALVEAWLNSTDSDR
jgi:hypothetical protein